MDVSIAELLEIAASYGNHERRSFVVRGAIQSMENDGSKGALFLRDASGDVQLRVAVQRYFTPSGCGNNTYEQICTGIDRGALFNYDSVMACNPGDVVEAHSVLMVDAEGSGIVELWSDKVIIGTSGN